MNSNGEANGKTRILVAANRTAASDELLVALSRLARTRPTEFVLVVPATPRGLAWATNMHAGEDDALAQLHAALRRFRGAGLEIIHARIGDPDPLGAIVNAAADEQPHAIVVSTLPRRLSKWLRIGLPERLEHATSLPVEHVTAIPRRHRRTVDQRDELVAKPRQPANA